MNARAVIGAGDLPLLVRAQRVPLELTRSTIELCCAGLVAELAGVEACILRLDDAGMVDPESARTRLVAHRILLVDALAELRGER